jgi:hypothetical protein
MYRNRARLRRDQVNGLGAAVLSITGLCAKRPEVSEDQICSWLL